MTMPLLMQAVTQAATSTAQGALASADPNPLRDWVASGAAIYYFQKWLKGRVWYGQFVGAFPGADKWAHRAIPMLGAMLATLGIHYTWSGTLLNGGTLTVLLPPVQQLFAGLGHFGLDVGGIFGIQQTIYECSNQRAFVPAVPPPAVNP